MPFGPEDVLINLYCGIRDDGRWHGTFSIQIRANRLRQLGLHPDQPWSRITGPERPAWARAEALRYMIGAPKHRWPKDRSPKPGPPRRGSAQRRSSKHRDG